MPTYKQEDEYFIPRILKSREFVNAIEDRDKFYQSKKDQPFVKIIGNNDWIMWIQNCFQLSSSTGLQYYKDELGDIERAVFGCLCGNSEPLMQRALNWHDRSWADFKSSFSSKDRKRDV